MTTGVRGFNPIWYEVNLQGMPFDDSYYLWVVENFIPYIPVNVYHDVDLSIAWSQPIQFLANGTLPTDIFFDPTMVYRLEFRQNTGCCPPSQNDALIYEINDYSPGSGGITPTPVVSTSSQNEITNPQFALVNFASPLSITTSGTYEIAPGWFLDLGGTGTATITQVPLNKTNPTTSNAPYLLHLVLAGWTPNSVILRQRFQQSGVLWSGKNVACALTAGTGVGFQSLTGNLVDSQANLLATVISVPTINTTLTEFTGHGLVAASLDTTYPPAAYIEFQILLASNNDIYLSSIQLVVEDATTPFEPTYIQDTIDRQIDHTFHYYMNSLLREQKQSYLTGWDFGLNPWQFTTTAATDLANNAYTADQTIVIQQAYVASATANNISTARGTAAQNYAFQVTAKTATNQFALLQYIDSTTIRTAWGNKLSSLVKLNSVLQTSTLAIKMKLIYRTTLPAATSQTVPVASWTANGEPVFSAGWTAITAKNDPVYVLPSATSSSVLLWESFNVPASSADLMTLGIFIYTTGSMISTGTADTILFNNISLVKNDFAIEVPSLTFDETLRRCQYYYTKSFLVGTLPATGVSAGASYGILASTVSSTQTGPIINFATPMRASPSAITLYNPGAANNDIRNISAGSDFSGSATTLSSANGFVTSGTPPGGSVVGNVTGVQWTATAQLGI